MPKSSPALAAAAQHANRRSLCSSNPTRTNVKHLLKIRAKKGSFQKALTEKSRLFTSCAGSKLPHVPQVPARENPLGQITG